MRRGPLAEMTVTGFITVASSGGSGTWSGAAVDVFEHEPPDARHPLRGCKNVVLTPHTAGQTREAMDRMVEMMLENVHRVARGEEPMHRVA